MAINKVVYGDSTLIDLTTDTVTAEVLKTGYIAHDKAGNIITGTLDGVKGSVYQDIEGFIVVNKDPGMGQAIPASVIVSQDIVTKTLSIF